MSDKSLLCRCTFCLDENVNGVLLNRNTYNRHRSRIQDYSVKDENLEDMPRQMKEDMPLDTEEDMILNTEEDIPMQIEGDIYQQEDNLDLVNNDSDTENFNFNEEDGEYYSDYNDDDDNDDKNNEIEVDDYEDNDEDDDEDDDNDDDNDDDDTMHVDNKTNIPIEGLKLLHLKSLYNFTESAYDDIMEIFTTNNISLYKVKTYLKKITGLMPVFYDMCENSCICYTGQYESYQNCPICDSTRLDERGKAKKIMPYLSIKDRLKIQFNDENRAKELLYRYEYIISKNDNDLDDIFDGKIYKELVDENLFNDKRDVAFTASCDGYQIFKQKTDDCWLFLMINNNLDPSIRVKKENLLIPFLIPGPNQPKEFNTFLRPFIDEMKELERKKFILSLFIIKIN
jgi:Transposase family tnp2